MVLPTLTTLEVTKVVTLTLGLEVISREQEKASTFLSRSTVRFKQNFCQLILLDCSCLWGNKQKKKKKGVNVLVNEELRLQLQNETRKMYLELMQFSDLPDS